MLRRAPATLALALSLALPTFAHAQAPIPADKDAPRTTPGGTSFTLPAGWTMSTKDALTILTPPETDTHIAILDVKAKDADAAVAAGWAAYQPGFKRPLKIALPQAPREGWEERRAYQYESSPNERVIVQALAWRAGDTWTVTIVDASEPTAEKRGGPLGILVQSLRPKGFRADARPARRHVASAGHLDGDRTGDLCALRLPPQRAAKPRNLTVVPRAWRPGAATRRPGITGPRRSCGRRC